MPEYSNTAEPTLLAVAISRRDIPEAEPEVFDNVIRESIKIEEGFLWMAFPDGTMHLINTEMIFEVITAPMDSIKDSQDSEDYPLSTTGNAG